MFKIHRRAALILGGAAALFAGLAPITQARASVPMQTPVMLRPSDANGNELSGPGYWVLTANPGTTVNMFAYVGNMGSGKSDISVVPVDARSGPFGGVSYNLPQEQRATVGSWVHLSSAVAHLDTGRATIIPFTIQIPHDARPGQYLGALTAFVPVHTASTTGRGASLTVQPRVVTAIEITIPGATYARLKVAGLQAQQIPHGLFIVIHIQNNGTALTPGQGSLWVYRVGQSKPIVKATLNIGTTVPHTTVNYPIRWQLQQPVGQYHFRVDLRWVKGQTSSRGDFTLH